MSGAATETQILEKAIAQGYNPDFEGEGKKNPEQFIADGEKIAGVQSKLNTELKAEIQSLKDRQKEFFTQQFKMNAESEKRGYDKALKSIEDKQLKAVDDADTDLYRKLEKEKKDLKKPTPEQPTKANEQTIDPEFDKWHPQNKWYKIGSNEPVSIYAEAVHHRLLIDGTDLKGKALYDKIKADVKLVFPDIDGKKTPNNLDISDHTGNDASSGKELPPEAKKALNQQIKSLGLTKEEQKEWKAQYWGSV